MLEVYNKTLSSKYNEYVASASRHIDVLTLNRIPAIGGFEKLTKRQQDVVSLVCEHLAIFEYENHAALTSPFKSGSISGISVTIDFNGDNFYKECGIVMPRADYELLLSTGLCKRSL